MKLAKSYVVVHALWTAVATIPSGTAATLVYNGGFVSSIEGLIVDNVTYNAFVHVNTSFAALWDPNLDGDYSDSQTGSAPAFLGNQAGAASMAQEVVAAMGTTNYFYGDTAPSDSFVVPYDRTANAFTGYLDLYTQAGTELLTTTHGARVDQTYPGTTQSVLLTFTPIPEPSSLLLSAPLIALFLHRRRRPTR